MMIKKYFSLYILLVLLAVIMYSCDSFFEEKPQDASDVDDVLQTDRDAQIMINGVYVSFMSSSSYGYALTVLPDLMTDAAFAAKGYSNSYGDPYSWKIYPGTSQLGAVWANHYSALYNANFLINNISNVTGDQELIDKILGEAYVARALLHHNLVKLYGKPYNAASATDLGVPYITYNKISNPERNTVEDVYQYIIADLDTAFTFLPISDEYSFNKDNFSDAFANGLRARVALEMGNYTEAITYSSKVIEASYLSLTTIDTYPNMLINDEGSEIIFRVGYTPTDYGSSLGYYFYNRNGFTAAPRPDYLPADWWIESLDKYSNDIRRSTNIINVYTDYNWTGNLINKYPTNPIFDSQGINMPKPMRLAEMYLIRAEAFTYLGSDLDAAIDDLNTLGNNRIYNFIELSNDGDGTQSFLKEYIKTERKKELMYEGFYWYDLKRFGEGFARIPQENTSYANDLEIDGDDYRWQWPIPTTELNGSGNITQNPGY